MKKILIVHDFITTTYGFHDRHLHFIDTILKYLELQTTLATKENFAFSKETLFKKLNQTIPENTISYIHENELTPAAYDYIHSFIKEYDIIIGFELSLTTKNIFEYFNLIYVDIWLSPIRFYKDLMFEFYSNNKTIQKRLGQYIIKETKLYQTAKKIKNYTRSFLNSPQNIEPNSLLLIGQLSVDKAVMRDNYFLTLLDFKSEIKSLSLQYSKIYLSKHPLMQDYEFETIISGLSDIQNLYPLENQYNTYELLCNKNIQCVAAISSSVLTEAVYFNKNITYLYKPTLKQNYCRVHKKFLKTNFWSDLFNIKKKKNCEYLSHDNFLRYNFDAPYSYKLYLNDNQDFIFYKKLINIQKFLQELNQEKDYILYGYGSIGKLILPHIPNLKGIIDQNKTLNKELNISMLSLNDLIKYPQTYVVISPFIYSQEIKTKLKLYTNNILEIPY